jgi:hypothetical protein
MPPAVFVSWLLFAVHVLVIVVAAVLISANRKPSSAIAWILSIIFVPVLGILFFLLVGFGKLPRERRDKQREVCEAVLARTDGLDRVSHRDEWPGWLASMVTMNRNLGSLPMVGGNSAELIESYTAPSRRWPTQSIGQTSSFVSSSSSWSKTKPPRPSSMPSSGLVDEEFRYVHYPITLPSSCIPIARRRSTDLPRWGRSIGRCCHYNRCAGIGADQTFAIIASSS